MSIMKRPLILVFVLFILLAGGLTVWSLFAPDRSTPAPPRVAEREGAPSFEVRPKQRAATAAEKQGATRSILAQLDAFRRDDYQVAARYQSEGLRRNFGSTEAFQNVIEKSYPQFAHYKSVTFGAITAQGTGKTTAINVPISLVGQDGVKVQATYSMILENGIYCVGGVIGGVSQSAPPAENKPEVPPAFKDVAPLIT